MCHYLLLTAACSMPALASVPLHQATWKHSGPLDMQSWQTSAVRCAALPTGLRQDQDNRRQQPAPYEAAVPLVQYPLYHTTVVCRAYACTVNSTLLRVDFPLHTRLVFWGSSTHPACAWPYATCIALPATARTAAHQDALQQVFAICTQPTSGANGCTTESKPCMITQLARPFP
jgi:hypothetical protein